MRHHYWQTSKIERRGEVRGPQVCGGNSEKLDKDADTTLCGVNEKSSAGETTVMVDIVML